MHLASDFLVSSTPTLEPDAKDCELHNSYDTQSCILSAIAILLGSLICFFGYRIFKFMLFLAGFLTGFFFTYMLCSGYLTEHLSGKFLEHKDQIFLGASVGVGIVAGLLTLCIFYLGLFILGATMGWFVGMVCLPLLYKHSEYLSEHTWLPYIVLCAFAIVGGVLILCIQRVVIVIASSFLGAFGCINGLDYFVENSRSLYYSVNILHGHFDKSDLPTCWYTWLILCLIPVMFIGGLAVQLGITGKGRDHREAYGRRSRVHPYGTPMTNHADQQPIIDDVD